jgi:hypothetical protein
MSRSSPPTPTSPTGQPFFVDPSGLRFQFSDIGVRAARLATSRAAIGPNDLLPIICIFCNPVVFKWTMDLWNEFVDGMQAVVREVTPYLKTCASGALQGALIAKWSVQSAIASAAGGCAVNITVRALRDAWS